MFVVRLRNKGKSLPSYITRARRTRTQVVQQKQNEKNIVLGCGRKFYKYRQLGGRIVMEESSVNTILRFNKEKEDKD